MCEAVPLLEKNNQLMLLQQATAFSPSKFPSSRPGPLQPKLGILTIGLITNIDMLKKFYGKVRALLMLMKMLVGSVRTLYV